MRSLRQLWIWILCLIQTSLVLGVKFELHAQPAPGGKRCVLQYIQKDVLAVGHFEISDGSDQRIDVEFYDDDAVPNKYFTKGNVPSGSQKFTFTTHNAGNIFYCFTSTLSQGLAADSRYKRTITLHVDTGADAEEAAVMFKDKKLKPMEMELYRLERLAEQVVSDLERLKERESEMRNINENTNERVMWFSSMSVIVMVGVGGWQIWYLRKFFQSKKLI